MKEITYSGNDEVSFYVEWFKIDLDGDIEDQVHDIWDEDYHWRNESRECRAYDTAMNMAKIILQSTDYNYAMVSLTKWEINSEGDREVVDGEVVGELFGREIISSGFPA